MTCIVAVESPDGVWIGADASLTIGARRTTIDPAAKLTRCGLAVLGFAGDVGHTQALAAALRLRERPLTVDVARWLGAAFRRAARQSSADRGERDFEAMAIVDGGIWTIDAQYAVTRSTRGYEAVGSGDDFALGALHALSRLRPRARVVAALAAAAEHAPTVCRPFHVERVAGPR